MKQKLLLLAFFFLTVNNVFSQTVYITKTGEKYHTKECQYLKKSSIKIELEKAIEAGYEACKVCKPGSVVSGTVKKESANSNQQKSSSVQCSGTTKKGARCKRMTTNSNRRCWQH